MLNLLGVHKPGTDGSDQSLLSEGSISEGDEHVPTGCRGADAEIARLGSRVGGIGDHVQRSAKHRFDLIERDTVLLTFLAVSIVPVEASQRVGHVPYVT